MRQPVSPSGRLPFADRALTTLERFLHIEAVSGIVLLLAAAIAVIWANSPAAESYVELWHTPIHIGIGTFVSSQSLHFWINDGLMTVFFLVVGLEIKRELHEGALAHARVAALPLAAALGGVTVPALIYFAVNGADPALRAGWAIPTATDIAFAVGVLALLGKSVPASLRVLLLAIAVIDDIAAVIVIALFYSDGVNVSGFALAALGIAFVLIFQRSGVRSAVAYIVPGAIVWAGLLLSGIHPTLTGVVLGLLTPMTLLNTQSRPNEALEGALAELTAKQSAAAHDVRTLGPTLRFMREIQRELLNPVSRVQIALHPWVAFVIMPLFALANAGVSLADIDMQSIAARSVAFGVAIALVLGKPIGVIGACWLLIKAGLGQLPPGVTWRGIALVGTLSGIGFTMSIFIANLAFVDTNSLGAAKLGVLVGSALACVIGVTFGAISMRAKRSSPA